MCVCVASLFRCVYVLYINNISIYICIRYGESAHVTIVTILYNDVDVLHDVRSPLGTCRAPINTESNRSELVSALNAVCVCA